MKKHFSLLIAVTVLAFASTGNANITNATWGSMDSIINCQPYAYDSGSHTLGMYGLQYDVAGNTVGRLQGNILTDSPLDPVLTLSGTVENDTGNAWLGYRIDVVMSVPFTFTTPGPTVGNPPTGDWFVASTTAPTLQGGGPYAGDYLGSLLFSAGTPIGIGGDMEFLYSINFSGGLGFSFTQVMTPQFASVPEPSAFALAALGGLVLALRRRHSRG